jgi:hypothetical protein
MGQGGVMIFSVHTCYIATINGGKNGYEIYLGMMDDLYSLVIAVGCAIISF